MDHATAAATDRGGNLFITGYAPPLYITVAYSGAGAPLWTNRYNGLGSGNNYAYAIAVDSSGNVFVTGDSLGPNGLDYDRATIAYSNTGTPLWTNRYKGAAGGEDYIRSGAITAGSNGQVVVTGGSSTTNFPYNYDYSTVAYTTAGTPLWTNSYNGPGNRDDVPTAVSIAGDGTVFVTGFSVGAAWEYATLAYSASGSPLWTNRYSRALGYNSVPAALAVDVIGNVFVTGYSAPSGGGYSYATLAYSAAGAAIWTKLYSGLGIGDNYATAICEAGNKVFVTGYSRGVATGYDYATVAYSTAGAALWTNRYDGPRSTNDYAQAIATDSLGNVFVTGYSAGPTNFYPYYYDWATIAYSGDGDGLWTNRYNGAGSRDDYAVAMSVDASDNVFVAGYGYFDAGPVFGYPYAAIKYSRTGPYLSIRRASNNQIVLSWASAALVLQSAPSPSGPFTNIPSATSPYTNATLDPHQYFRLSWP